MFEGGLFTRDWLVEGVTGTTAWSALDDATVATLRAAIGDLLAGLTRRRIRMRRKLKPSSFGRC